jgi:UDP-N-acetylmuramoyl-tripeptide--D-alanyl-D-alanine ligase
VIVDREDKAASAASAGRGRPPEGAGPAVVLVRDTMAALADLGRAARARLRCPVIAVTGSCGKTTLKEMLGQVLAPHLRGTMPPASFNNQIGVPLTLLAAEPGDAFVLCEFGTNHPGEIAALAAIARPTIGIVTLVGPVHLEGLGSIEGVAKEKGALVELLPADGVAVLNADDPRVAAMAKRCRGRVVTVGLEGPRDPARQVAVLGAGNLPCWVPADLRVEDLSQTPQGLRFTLAGVLFEIPVLGRHQALLAAQAAAAAREVGVAPSDAAEALRQFRPLPMRLALQEVGGVLLLNDAFNANPLSMRAALDLLALWPDRRKVFFCGDMRELGAESRAAHETLGREAVGAGVARLVCVGKESRATAAAAVAAGLPADAVATFDEAATAAAAARRVVRDGDLVLVKGSHSIHMERVAEAITKMCTE